MIRALFNNYVIKNLILFVVLVCVSVSLIIIVHIVSSDRDAIQGKIAAIRKINAEFESNIASIVSRNYQAVKFLSKTSYPEIAIDFSMDAQFYDVVEDIIDNSALKVLLFNADGIALPMKDMPHSLLNEIYSNSEKLMRSGEHIYYGKDFVIYVTEILRDGSVFGYLAGMLPRAEITRSIENAYNENVADYYNYNPKIGIIYPPVGADELTLEYSYSIPMITGLKIKTVFLIVGVAFALLAIFTVVLRRSMMKPFHNIKNIIAQLSEDNLKDKGIEMPRDEMFSDIARSLLKMHDDRERLEADKRSREVSVKLADAASKIAHDMRSPLSVMKAYVLESGKSGVIERQYVKAAERSVDKLTRMADDFLDYAKSQRLNREVISLHQTYFGYVAPELNGKLSATNGILNVDISRTLYVSVDNYKMTRVLTNMICNALKATDESESSINLIAYTANRKDLAIQIKDNGCGIDAKDLPHIFENFFSTDRKKGTGLGLSYCKQVVEAHGGTIDVESEVGKGTTFTIRIPDCVVSESEARAYANDARIHIDGRRFVLVDDDADIRVRWRNIVEQGGGRVVAEADSPEKATGDELDVSCADVAIVDYSFEGSVMTGVDVVAHLKRMGLKEVHMCTGYADDESIRQAAMDAGADSVIQKELG